MVQAMIIIRHAIDRQEEKMKDKEMQVDGEYAQVETILPAKKTGLGSVVKSILAAAIGVQTNKNRKQDFEEGNLLAFIIGGFIFTLVFIVTIATIVGFVLSRS
jgi:hypothetical protein